MAIVTTDSQHYSDIANALRANGIDGSLMPCEMAEAISEISGSVGIEITDGMVITARNAEGYATEVETYLEIVPNYQFKVTTHNSYYNIAWRSLTSVVQKTPVKHIGIGALSGCSNLRSFDFSEVLTLDNDSFSTSALAGEVYLPKCTTISSNISDIGQNIGTFGSCAAITSINAPLLTAVGRGWIYGCTGITSLYLPHCTSIYTHISSVYAGAFSGLTSLESVQLGSVGYGVTHSGNTMFGNCSQRGLTVTAYCNGAYADTLIANIRNGATNADIVIKASEDTTYNGVAYASGDTIITSTIEVSA